MDAEEDDEEGEESRDKEGVDDGNQGKSQLEKFSEKWLWIDWCVRVREIYGCKLSEVYDLNVMEYLNYICYIKDKSQLEESYLKNKNIKTY